MVKRTCIITGETDESSNLLRFVVGPDKSLTPDILNKLPVSASNLFAKNVFNFISNLYDKESDRLNFNLEDEIIEKTLIK